MKISRVFSSLCLAALSGIFLFHFYLVCSRSVDILIFDEWVMWWPRPGQSWFGWLVGPYNEFLLIPTKVLIFFCERFLAGDPRPLIALNFIFYAGVPIWFLAFAWRSGRVPVAGVALLGIFYFSPIAFENHFMALQSCFHLSLLFPLAAISLFFQANPSSFQKGLGLVALLLAIFSSAAGGAAALAVASVYLLTSRYQVRQRAGAASVLFAVVVGLGVWAVARQMPGQPVAAITFPWTKRFWDFLLNAVSGGWGIDRESTLIGGICFLFALTPMLGLIRKGRRAKYEDWAMVAVLAMAFAICTAITLARGYSAIGASKSSRYREYEMLFLFAVPVAYSLWLPARRRAAAIAVLCGICLYTFYDNWDFSRYESVHEASKEGRRCVVRYLNHGGTDYCPAVLPGPLAPHLDVGQYWNSPLLLRLKSDGAN